MDKAEKMQGFLSKASSIIKKTEQLSPTTPKNYIPSMSESAKLAGLQVEPSYDVQPSYNNVRSTPNPNSKLPKSIFESISENPIQSYGGSGGSGGFSVLDSIMPNMPSYQEPAQYRPQVQQNYNQYDDSMMYGEKPLPDINEEIKLLKERRGVITENQYQPQTQYQQPQPQQQSYQPQSAGGVDYSIIRMMLEDIVSKEIRQLKKSLLTESKQLEGGQVVIKVGNGIQFITNNGDVFGGSLKKIGNVKVGDVKR